MAICLGRCLKGRGQACRLLAQRRYISSTHDRSQEVVGAANSIEKAPPQNIRSKPTQSVPTRGRTTHGLKLREPSSTRLLRVGTDVAIHVDGQPHNFSPLLLRDLCECPHCVDPSTKQKYRPTTDIPTSITPRAISQTESGVSILWHEDVPGYGRDHSTEIGVETLRQYVQSGVTGLANMPIEPRTLWDAEQYSQLPDIPYEDYMESDASLYHALRQLHTHGLAFLSDVPGTEKSVSTIAERIGPVKNTFYGYTWDVRSVPQAKNVAYTSQDLGFHMDLLYMEQPPHLQFLHCIRSSSAGGASLFTDSFRSASDLLDEEPSKFEALAENPVSFHYNHPSSNLYHQRRKVFEFQRDDYRGSVRKSLKSHGISKKRSQLDDVDSKYKAVKPLDLVEAVSWSPPFQAPFGRRPPSNLEESSLATVNGEMTEWHKAAQEFNRLIHRPQMIYERLMRPGECVLFDNRRVLHARKAFEVGDAGKERWLRGAYLDKDPYLSKLRVLQHQLGKSGGGLRHQDENEEYVGAAVAMV